MGYECPRNQRDAETPVLYGHLDGFCIKSVGILTTLRGRCPPRSKGDGGGVCECGTPLNHPNPIFEYHVKAIISLGGLMTALNEGVFIDATGFTKGETILYCPKCAWQTKEHCAMKPICPDCNEPLRLWKVD